jgi:hypothetical protein
MPIPLMNEPRVFTMFFTTVGNWSLRSEQGVIDDNVAIQQGIRTALQQYRYVIISYFDDGVKMLGFNHTSELPVEWGVDLQDAINRQK